MLLVGALAACGGEPPRDGVAGGDASRADRELPVAERASTSSAASFDPDNLPPDAALDPARKGPAFGSDAEAVAAFEAAYRDVDLDRMQEIWWRMSAAQRFAAHEAGKAISDEAAMSDYQRMLPAEYLLDAENVWALQDAAEREARGEEPAAPAPVPAIPEIPEIPDSERGTVRGVLVVEGSGDPVAGVALAAQPRGHALLVLAGAVEPLGTVTASDGTFEIQGVPAGEITLVGQKLPYYTAIIERATVVARDTVEVRIEVPPPPEWRLELPVVVAGVVRDELTGEPVARVHVSAGRHGGALTDARGRYLIGEADLGEIALATEHADYHPTRSTLVAESRGRIDHDLSIRPITTGVLEGVVVDRVSGLPLAGATVVLSGERITTDHEGRFRLEEVEAGEITLTGHSEKHRAAISRVLLERRATAQARLELDPITEGTVAGIVTDAATGKPLAGARVEIGPRAAESGADGRFELADVPAGEVGITAGKAVYEPAMESVEVIAADSVEIALALEPITYGTVVVRVADAATGSPLAGSEVRLGANLTARTDGRGRARFEKVPAGRGAAVAALHAYESGTGSYELAPATEVEATVRLEPITVGAVEGRVVASGTRRPIPGAEVAIADRRVTADGEGRFRLDGVSAGPANVTARKAVFESGSRSVDVVAAEAVAVEIALDPITWGTLTGEVADRVSGQPIAGARVTVPGASTTTDERGRFVLERVPAGELLLSATRPVYEPASDSLLLEPAATLERRLLLDPITYGRLTGRVVDADDGRPLGGVAVSVGGQRSTSGTDGRFEVDRVDAGRLTLSARKTAYHPGGTSLTLEPGGTAEALIELEPIKVGTVAGIVRDARTGEPIAGARVAVGGREVETDAQGRFRVAEVDAGSIGASARHADYGDGAVSGQLPGSGTLDLEIRLDLRREDVTQLESALASKGTIDLYGIHFDSGKDQFKPSSLGTLNAVLEVIKRAPGRTFRIAGHTDSDGTDAYNQDLSERRAKTVIGWLVERGIEPQRLRLAGYGESRPAATNDTPSGKALNRRVELGYAG